MRFRTFGPFLVNANIQNKSDDLGNKFDGAKAGLNDASGVYIFAYRKEGQLIPIYVGKAQRQSFATRISQHLNGLKFADFLGNPAGTLNIFLIARVDTQDEFLFTKVAAEDEFTIISELEFSLIGSCAAINPELLNLHKLKHPEDIQVPGYLGSIPDSTDTPACELARMLRTKLEVKL